MPEVTFNSLTLCFEFDIPVMWMELDALWGNMKSDDQLNGTSSKNLYACGICAELLSGDPESKQSAD